MNKNPIRCVNLDWLEVHCLEPHNDPHDADYFRRLGLVVNERAYGTRVYREMFTVYLGDRPFIEVRRNPASQGLDGIHLAEECHLRLVNSYCYADDAAEMMQQFIDTYHYTFSRISRVDVCLDFELFDQGDEPAKFLRRYLQHRYAKINQGTIRSHGHDTWSGQEWNSISWGAPSSDIGTKFYNKTLELYEPSTQSYRKPYIRYAWFKAGLIDDMHFLTKTRPDGTAYTPQIWRVEFTIRSSVKKWFAIEVRGNRRAKQSIHNTLDVYNTRPKLLTIFASLANHYFHFKHYQEGVRKDRCPDKVLFDFTGEQYYYKVQKPEYDRLSSAKKPEVKPLDSLLHKLKTYALTHTTGEVHEACNILIRAIEGECLQADLHNPFSRDELFAMRQALSLKLRGRQEDYIVLLREIRKLLDITDRTAIF